MLNVKDPLICTYILFSWGIIFSFILYITSEKNMNFNIGPSEDRYFMSIHINNWYKWVLFALLIMMDKFINSVGVDIIGNWINNNLHNQNIRFLNYDKNICHLISNFYSFYFNIRYIMTLNLLISQIDYAILRVFSDVIATHYTVKINIANKEKID